MESRLCFEYRWGLKPVLIYALCHTKPIFDFDYHNKRSNTPNNMSSRKRSNTYWSTNTFAPSVAICIARTICLCSSEAMCIDQSILHRRRATTCTGQPIYHPESAAICIDYTNMPPKFNMIYNTYWNIQLMIIFLFEGGIVKPCRYQKFNVIWPR